MIHFYCAQQTMIENFTLEQVSDVAACRALIIKSMRKGIGRRIKPWIKYGIRPNGKMKTYHEPTLEDYDGERWALSIRMEGTFFQVLHAYRDGLWIERPRFEWSD